MSTGPVLLTWVAVNNDPFEKNSNGALDGPTLSLLYNPSSPYANKVSEVVLFHRCKSKAEQREQKAVTGLLSELNKRKCRVHREEWNGDDPTDHSAIFTFLDKKLPELRKQYNNRELIIHISPGTPSMQTIWVLMAETGFITKPFKIVKSYRPRDSNTSIVVPVQLDIETFYKTYKNSQPCHVSSDEQNFVWDPHQFATKKMQQVYAEAKRFAKLKVPLLIRGERGTGKTTLASWIRANSPFARKEQNASWPNIVCGQYTTETMRAELFGYKKGSFTGAVQDRNGLLKSAHGDTLFLDEIGDISVDLQRLLIRAVEEKKFLPLGAEMSENSDFRLITATNLDDIALQERLTPDFYDRISIFSLRLPSLREIPEELPWLWEGVYEKACQQAMNTSRKVKLTTTHHNKIVKTLMRNSLSGNLRDLFRVAYHIIAAINDDMTKDDAVEYGLSIMSSSRNNNVSSLSHDVAKSFVEGSSLDAIIKQYSFIPTKNIINDFKKFIAIELKKSAFHCGVNIEDVVDVSERSLSSWKMTE